MRKNKVTQIMIAKKVGVDVSTANKILNGVRGPVFRKRTIERVLRVATKLGYVRPYAGRHELRKALVEVLEAHVKGEILPEEKVTEFRALLQRAGA